MEQLLWSFEDLKKLTTHSDVPVRRWAMERLIQCYPNQAGDVLVSMLDDQGVFIVSKICDFLANTGEADKYGPSLLEQLQENGAGNTAALANALAQLRYQPALPKLLELAKVSLSLKSNEASSVILALGRFGGDDVRQTLWKLLEEDAAAEGKHIFILMDALLEAAQPEDIERLVDFYRPLPVEKRSRGPLGRQRQPIFAFAKSVGVEAMVETMLRRIRQGFWSIMEIVDLELDAEVELSEEGWRDLEKAFHRFSNVYEVLLREARRMVEERGDDMAGWQATWEAGERPVGYRQLLLYAMLMFEAFAKQPMTTLTRRQQESVLGAALLSKLSVSIDEQARLDAAEDKTAILLELLARSQEDVLPGITTRVAELGPEIVPRLIDVLDPEDDGWATIRAARALEQIARAHPGSCDVAIPRLLACIHDKQGDFLLEATADALRAIGPAAVAPINNILKNTQDTTQDIFLTGILADIPLESATEVILARLKAGKPLEEPQLMALSDIGSATALESLYQLWQDDDDAILAEQLLILCEVNGIEKPELPKWRQLIEEQDAKMGKMLSRDIEELFAGKDFITRMQQLAASPPKPRSWGGEQEPEVAKASSKGTAANKKPATQSRRTKKKKRR